MGSESHIQRIAKLQLSNPISRDIEVHVSDLMVYSKYFQTRFSDPTEISPSITFPTREIPSFNILKQIVKLMTGKATTAVAATEDSLEELINTADFLQIDSVLRALLEYLRRRLPSVFPDEINRQQVHLYLRLLNVIMKHCHLLSVELDRKGTIHCCAKHGNSGGAGGVDAGRLTYDISPQFFILYHFKSIMYERALVELNYRSIYSLLLSDHLRISEEDVVRTIKMWINHEYKSRIQHYSFLLRLVRFDPEMKVEWGFCVDLVEI